MIHVTPHPEPNDFDHLVRQPGLFFLSKRPNPTTDDFKNHDYWTRIIPQMRVAYGQICAYCCEYIPYLTGNRQVEHFWPKSEPPHTRAYDWNNYRLVCGIINGRKGVKTILDPFYVEDGWFAIQFPSLQIVPGKIGGLSATLVKKIEDTITVLKLNDEGENIPAREWHLDVYCEHGNFQHLMLTAPFLAKELTRQNLQQEIKKMRSQRSI